MTRLTANVSPVSIGWRALAALGRFGEEVLRAMFFGGKNVICCHSVGTFYLISSLLITLFIFSVGSVGYIGKVLGVIIVIPILSGLLYRSSLHCLHSEIDLRQNQHQGA